MIYGWPLPKRKAHIEKITKEQSSTTWPVPFRNRMRPLPIYSVPIDFPKYRLENGRTVDRQTEYLARKRPDLPKDFFRRDFELDVAQRAQDEILRGLVAEKNLLATFQKVEQDEPLILNDTGFVVNGNRRLCAMRLLYDEEPKKFKRFRNVDVVFLPPCDPTDIDAVEAELQLREDIKSDYKWTAFAAMLREKKALYKWNDKQLASMYDRPEKEIRELLDILAYAEVYLEDRGHPYEYHLVEKAEYAFRQLRAHRKKIKTEPKKEIYERAAFCLIDKPEEGRIYSEIPKIAENLDVVIDRLKDELDYKEGRGGEEQKLLKLADALSVEKNFDSVRAVVRDSIQAARSKEKAKKKTHFVITQISRARALLEQACLAIDDKSVKAEAKEELAKIDGLLAKLRRWANG